jgi:hypothetical protein
MCESDSKVRGVLDISHPFLPTVATQDPRPDRRSGLILAVSNKMRTKKLQHEGIARAGGAAACVGLARLPGAPFPPNSSDPARS